MLDDLKFIHHRDGSDALGIAERQASQLEHSFEFENSELNIENCQNIVLAGMGGSALAGLLSKSWPGYKVPFEVVRNYHIPEYVSDTTLFIASSYSGNTEEALEALSQAESKNAKIVVVASGGKLQEIAAEKNYPFLQIPKAEQPRYSVFSNLNAVVTILGAAGFLDGPVSAGHLRQGAEFLRQEVKDWLPTVPTDKNPAKKLAMELAGRSAVVYAGPLLAPVAYKWKISFNENAKNVAWWNEWPEYNHNEMIGWSSHPVQKPYGVIELRSNLEHPRIQKRFEVDERLLSGLRPAPHVIDVKGQTLLEQLLWSVAFGDFVTIYLGLVNNVDPAPVELVEKFKKALDS